MGSPSGRCLLHHVLSLRGVVCVLSALALAYLVMYVVWASPGGTTYRKFRAGGQLGVRIGERKDKVSHQVQDQVYVPDGRGVWINERNIQVISAIHDLHHLNSQEIRVVLPSFLRHSADRDFVCCFHKSVRATDSYLETPAFLDFIDLRFIVDMQNAAYTCLLNKTGIPKDGLPQYVSFAPRTCAARDDVSPALKVVYPVRRSWEFAVCTKVSYAYLKPSRLVEWFEYMREIGASKILTFHNNLHGDTRRVFDHYTDTGFLELVEYVPQIRRNGSRIRYTEKNSQTRQARHDKTLVVRDCQYRLGGYDFVLTIDFDELPVPMRPYGSLNWILQNLLRNHTDGAAFRMDPILMPPEWQDKVRDLYHWQFSTGTYIAPYCVKWAYIPARTWLAATHENVPKEGYQTYVIPDDNLHFFHFRSCKQDWLKVPCDNLTQTVKNEFSLKRFAGGVLRGMRKLPLEDLIPDQDYVNFVRGGSRGSVDTKRWQAEAADNILQSEE